MPRAQEKTDQRSRHAERYRAIARSGKYNDDPCKVETNARGEVVKEPPPAPQHKGFQKRIQQLLDRALHGGEATTEFPLHTREGTKLPDVAWFSREAWDEAMANDLAVIVPKVCVDVLSPSNTQEEMEEKKRLYFDLGVEEVWICGPQGHVQVFGPSGLLKESALVPDIPDPIDATSSGKIRPCIR